MHALSIQLRAAMSIGARFPRRLAALAALALLSDWLLYGHGLGISVTAFFLMLGLASIAANPPRASVHRILVASAAMLAGVLPFAIGRDVISLLFAALGVAYFVLMASSRAGSNWAETTRRCGGLVLGFLWRPLDDFLRASLARSRMAKAGPRSRWLAVWITPIALGGVFLALFAAANPLIDDWLAAIDFSGLLEKVTLGRVLFWTSIVAFAWSFVFLRARRKRRTGPAAAAAHADTSPIVGLLLGKDAILRSLLLFNGLFAVQTVLDLVYLWGGARLPDGMDYATYAHRGAYPLIVTALLAAVFVLVSMRPGTEAERSPLIRRLVYFWTAQNVVLVVSSLLRLDLYVQVYSLTYWRVAAFIWMLLVAVGLPLIVARIAFDRSNSWLIGTNLASLAGTLYVCGFVNFPLLIADYNVLHGREVSGSGEPVDQCYLLGLGPRALPAIDRYLSYVAPDAAGSLILRRSKLAAAHIEEQKHWRAWSVRDWQLSRYLAGRRMDDSSIVRRRYSAEPPPPLR